MNIIYLFPICVATGFIFLLLTSALLYTSIYALAILPIICKFKYILEKNFLFIRNLYVVFSFTSAVTTSLQYTVSNQLFEKDQIEHGYIFHVIITSLGSIIGPVIGGKRKKETKDFI